MASARALTLMPALVGGVGEGAGVGVCPGLALGNATPVSHVR